MSRQVPFSKVIYIERDDFREDPAQEVLSPRPGREVRLRYAYYITCTGVVKDSETGEVTELHCTYDPETRGGSSPDGRQVKSTIHWVSAAHSLEARVRLYDHLFTKPNPGETEGEDFRECINPNSLVVPGRMPPRAGPWRKPCRQPVPVREAGLFLRGPGGFRPGNARLQQDGGPPGHLGQNREG